MKAQKQTPNGIPNVDLEFDKGLAAAKARPELPASQELLEDQSAWIGSEGRLIEELTEQIEANAPLAMMVSPKVHAEVWRYATYVMEREGVDLHQAVAHLMEEGMKADSDAIRIPLRSVRA